MASRPNPPKERLATPGPPNVVTNGIGGRPGARPPDEAECWEALPHVRSPRGGGDARGRVKPIIGVSEPNECQVGLR